MPSSSAQIGALGSHAVCMAAGFRDGLRTAQYYARDLGRADRFGTAEGRKAPSVSRLVATVARGVDWCLAKSADLSIRLILPSWRSLPSPFEPGFLQRVEAGIHQQDLIHNPLFNAYFFRAALRILERCTQGSPLVLEHRVDAARRALATLPGSSESKERHLARIMIALAGQHYVARAGRPIDRYSYLAGIDESTAISAISCIALLFADEGQAGAISSEDEFFDVTAALIGPRLKRLAELVGSSDDEALASELQSICDLY